MNERSIKGQRFSDREDFVKYLDQTSADSVRQDVMRQMCIFINQYALNPREMGFWYSSSSFILFSLADIYKRALSIVEEHEIPLSSIQVDIKGEIQQVIIQYPHAGHISSEVHEIGDYILFEEDLYDFLQR